MEYFIKILEVLGFLKEPICDKIMKNNELTHIKNLNKEKNEDIINEAKAKKEAKQILNSTQPEELEAKELLCKEMEYNEFLNISSIVDKATENLYKKSNIENLKKDWLIHFFEKSKLASDPETQILWAKVLSLETETPGTFSKRTLSKIGELEKEEIESFIILSQFSFYTSGRAIPLIFREIDQIFLNENRLNFIALSHLEDIGLIKMDSSNGYNLPGKGIQLSYHYNQIITSSDSSIPLIIGNVLFTRTGLEILKILERNPSDKIYSHCLKKLRFLNPHFQFEEYSMEAILKRIT